MHGITLNSRPARVVALLMILITLSTADLYLTMQYMTTRGMYEADPLVHALREPHGCWSTLAVFKSICLALAVAST